jgi:hypothetical protein
MWKSALITVALSLSCAPAEFQMEDLVSDSGSGSLDQDDDGDGWAKHEDCDDDDPSIHPDALELCDEIDNDCDEDVDEDVGTTWYADHDDDGYGSPLDTIDACDMPDGYVPTGTDCDDANADTWPGAAERCDHEDNDCDGETDESLTSTWYDDEDGDGFGDGASPLEDCDPGDGWVENSDDCDDDDAAVHPEAPEICDLIDNDCDAQIDEDVREVFFADFDGDGFGSEDESTESCDAPSGYLYVGPGEDFDCDDGNDAIYPGAQEICDRLDNDCDGSTDDDDSSVTGQSVWFLDFDGDGYGTDRLTMEACDAPSGYVATDDDCDDTTTDVMPDPSGGCALGLTCLDILDAGRDDGDGIYSIDPDGWDAILPPFDVYCDMESDDPGWTEIAYSADLAMAQHYGTGNTWQSLPTDFSLELSDAQIDSIRALSTEGKQKYEARCEGVVHYYHEDRDTHYAAVGFILHNGDTTTYGSEDYSPYSVSVVEDGCKSNGGEGGSSHQATWFKIKEVGIPVVNLYTYDGGDSGEEFGAKLEDNSAWLR